MFPDEKDEATVQTHTGAGEATDTNAPVATAEKAEGLTDINEDAKDSDDNDSDEDAE